MTPKQIFDDLATALAKQAKQALPASFDAVPIKSIKRAIKPHLNEILAAMPETIKTNKMATQEQKKIGVWAILAPVLTELGKEGIEWLESRIAEHKQALLTPCPDGYTRAADGSCVKDPVPPDPTHQ